MSNLQVRQSTEDRHCGACTACCAYLTIPAGVVGADQKPYGVACPHAGPLGCRIHARRPRVCAGFACMWLRDTLWPPSWRPDRSGLLCVDTPLEPRVEVATVYEIRPAALAKPEATDILNHLLRTTVALAIVDAQGRCAGALGRTAVGQIAETPSRKAG